MIIFIVYPFEVDSQTSYNLLKVRLSKLGYSFIKSNRDDFSNAINLNIYNIGKDLEEISKCNLVLFAENWENDKNCKTIFNLCQAYSIPFTTEKELFSDIFNNEHISV